MVPICCYYLVCVCVCVYKLYINCKSVIYKKHTCHDLSGIDDLVCFVFFSFIPMFILFCSFGRIETCCSLFPCYLFVLPVTTLYNVKQVPHNTRAHIIPIQLGTFNFQTMKRKIEMSSPNLFSCACVCVFPVLPICIIDAVLNNNKKLCPYPPI